MPLSYNPTMLAMNPSGNPSAMGLGHDQWDSLTFLPSAEVLDACDLDEHNFRKLCAHIATRYVVPSLNRLEAEGVKTLPGSTQNGNALLLVHDLMTVREMHQAIKFGHPERMQRMLSFGHFYAGSNILRAGMFIITKGKPRTCEIRTSGDKQEWIGLALLQSRQRTQYKVALLKYYSAVERSCTRLYILEWKRSKRGMEMEEKRAWDTHRREANVGYK
ncbi:hypothetical protein GGX14DRAFT_546714 [Mycena pura]|uniref:DUF6589 domain-containing protein n=1 Tax=Mycena pura TaxID=153505 RepID=A0AAD6USL3_9AGAR|nr:hypothetical protein GGX14DRAFT_546714 [Mycena pura]